jgi:hypothetical protein
VTKVVANHCHIDARLQKGDRTTVTNHVGSHAAKPWCRVALCGEANVFLQYVSHAVPGEGRALMALKKHVVAAPRSTSANRTASGCRSRFRQT